jgi:hypothetical protein
MERLVGFQESSGEGIAWPFEFSFLFVKMLFRNHMIGVLLFFSSSHLLVIYFHPIYVNLLMYLPIFNANLIYFPCKSMELKRVKYVSVQRI